MDAADWEACDVMRRSDARKLKFRLFFSCLVVAVAVSITWLGGERPPPFPNQLEDKQLMNVASMTTLIPHLAGAMVAGNLRTPSLVVFGLIFIAQWFLIGFLLAMPFSILVDK
jgi:hypothetical protein